MKSVVVKFEKPIPKLLPKDKELRANEKLEAMVQHLREVKRELKASEAEEEVLVFRVKGYMNDATVLFDQSGTQLLATYRFTGEIDQFDAQAFAAAHPKLYRKFCKRVRQRRLVLK